MNYFDDSILDFTSATSPPAKTVELTIRALLPGPLPADGEVFVGGVPVPSGARIRPEQYEIHGPNGSEGLSELLACIGWYTPTDWGGTPDCWGQLANVFTRTGLWPVVGGPGNRCAAPARTQNNRPPSRDHGDEASNVLQCCWDGMALVNRETGEPLPEKRPPFAGVPQGAPPEDFVEKVPFVRSSHWGAGYGGAEAGLLLVSATRPADVPRLVGWTGPGNYFLGGREISAVLKSWEERFGAVLYQLGGTTMTLRVARPPSTRAAAQVLMEEHYLLCPDNFYPQDQRPPVSRGDYATRLVNAPAWDFWWD